MEKINRELTCEITRNVGEQLNMAKESEAPIVEAKLFHIDSNSIKHPVYHLKPSGFPTSAKEKTWNIIIFEPKPIDPKQLDKFKFEYTTKDLYIGTISNLPNFLQSLINHYKNGRMLVNYNLSKGGLVYGIVRGFYGRDIRYQQAKKILEFESKAGTTQPDGGDNQTALIENNPRMINTRIVFDNYSLEVWGSGQSRRSYSYVATNPETQKWVEKVCKQVPNI